MTIDSQLTVGELARGIRGATRIFERVGIDYCCGGDRTLTDACTSAGVDPEGMITELRGLEDVLGTGSTPGTAAMTLTELVGHIIDTYHDFTRSELTRLGRTVAKVLEKHGPNHPELAQVADLVVRLRDDLTPHMFKEEHVLFPYIVELDRAHRTGRAPMMPPFGTVRHPIDMMTAEHVTTGEILRALREATGEYVLPADACMTYRALYDGLVELERNIHEHIHTENNILFPRAIELEQR